jgi:hypothetical protein
MEDNLPTFAHSDAIQSLIMLCHDGDMTVSDVRWVRLALVQTNYYFTDEEREFFGSILQAVNTAPTKEIEDND